MPVLEDAVNKQMSDAGRLARYALTAAIRSAMRARMEARAKEARLDDELRGLEQVHGKPWTYVALGGAAAASEVARALSEGGLRAHAVGAFVLIPQDRLDEARSRLASSGIDAYVPEDGLTPGERTPDAGAEARAEASRRSAGGRAWRALATDGEETARAIAGSLRAAGIEAEPVSGDVVVPEERLPEVERRLIEMGGEVVPLAELARDDAERERAAADRARPATERQASLVERLAREGAISAAELERFHEDPSFATARALLNLRSGQVLGQRPRGPLDTDRDGIADANEDIDSDGLDASREEDPRDGAEPDPRETELDRLERECEAAAAIDQPHERSRSEISISPESR